MAWKFFTNQGREKVVSEETPAGLITGFSGTAAPDGWLLCQGQELLRSSYSALDQAIGITYGSYTNGSGADGTTHLRLPDLSGRVPVGLYAGAGDRTDSNGQLNGTGQITGGSTLNQIALGTWSGAEDLILAAAESALPAHNHPRSSDGQNKATVTGTHSHSTGNTYHTHTTRYVNQPASTSGNPNNWVRDADGSNSSGEYLNSAPSGIGAGVGQSSTNIFIVDAQASNASSAHNNMQQFIVINFIIKT